MMTYRAVYRNFANGGGGGGEFGVWKKEGGRKLTIVLCEAQGGCCYAGMLVSLWHANADFVVSLF